MMDGRQRETPPPHPHFTLGSIAVLGVALASIAAAIGITALAITASRNSVDDGIVAEKVAAALADGEAPADAGNLRTDVVPDLVPKSELPLAPESEVNVSAAPDAPRPLGRSAPAIVDVHFRVVEQVQAIDPAEGVTYETWGYEVEGSGPDGLIAGTPGPMIRTRVGDVLRFTITNPETNSHPHNVDFHAVTGQGGGAAATTVAPGETVTIEARMLYPGFFMYHCAYGDVPLHISHGMFGGILVEPAEPLPGVDHEWYVVQSEYYTTPPEPGTVGTDRDALTMEEPTYVVFNGAVGAIAGDHALQMAVGERARIYFVNAGLNLVSSFHPIGSHWDAVYPEAALLGPPLRGSQTTLVPAGGGTVVELIGRVPSTIILVDHALTRAFDKGALGQIVVSGPEDPEIFEVVGSGEEQGSETTGAPASSEVVDIVPGAWETQPEGAADEFAETEDPADYSVNVLRIPVGTTVTWTNSDSMLHTVTAVDGSFDSGFLDEGDSWSHTFTEPGEYEYYCLPHLWMRAKVIVEG
ncbi:MAG: nitrite reductase, copper-containing [Actinobacteria bacterium]|nr:nitrite reductase, copper-containing [Actinomycetota bacterium]